MEEPETEFQGKLFLEDNEKDYKLDNNIALLCGIELMTNLIVKFKDTIDSLYNYGVRINFFIIEDSLTYGIVGTDFTKLNQVIYSKQIKNMRNYIVS
jgi:hypothetical protein